MEIALKLALAYAVRHPTRMLLTSLAMVASACIVVWVVSSYDALASQFGEQAAGYLGRYDFFIVPEDPQDASVDPALAEALRKDPAVAEATPVIQIAVQITNPNGPGPGMGGPGMGGPGMGKRGTGGPGMGGPGMGGPGMGGPGMGGPGMGGPGMGGPGGPAAPQAGQSKTTGSGPGRPGMRGRPGGPRGFGSQPTMVGTDAAEPPHKLLEGSWIDVEHPENRGAVFASTLAEQLGVKLGNEVHLILGTKEYRIVVAGLIEEGPSQMGMGGRMRPPGSTKPRTGIEAGPASSAVYVPLSLAEHFSRGKAKLNLINIQLKPEAKSQVAEFRTAWEAKIARSKPTASMLGVNDIRTGIEEGMTASRTKQEAWAATGLSLLASLFIIFTTLSMGVAERVRQFAIMRAVGLTRGQVALVIGVESILLALIGWGGGLLAGWALLAVVSWMETGLFQQGPSLGAWCAILTGLSALGGSLAASVLPAWQAMRVQPLEAMSPKRSVRPALGAVAVFGILGLALIAVNPILVYVASTSMSTDKLYYIYMAVGCSTMAVGFLLLTPATILAVEAVLGPVVARLLGLEPRLLRSQLGSNLWRTLGTTAALTVGLGLFVSMQIWGYSMLEPFKPGDWNPDMLVSFQRGGLPDKEVEAVRSIPGVRADQCIPLAVEQPKLASDYTNSENTTSVIRQNNVIMIGLDPQVAFGGKDPLVKARFVEGKPEEVIARLKEGRYCIVPDHFLHAANMKVGDRFSMVPPEAPGRTVEYTIAGAVSLPGWHWMTKFSGLRRREGRSAAMVFADYETVKRDFEVKQINFFWLNVDQQYGEQHLDEAKKIDIAVKAAAANMPGPPSGGQAGSAPPQPPAMKIAEKFDGKRAAVIMIGRAIEEIAGRNPGDDQPVNGQGRWSIGATMFGPSVRVSTPDQVMGFIMVRASGMIWASCYLPLVTLVVTSLGVINTVMASVRARRWEFGVLRSQGVTRSGLIRMILAEGVLIGLITCLLSLGFGIFSGWCGTGISQYVSFFGGLAPPLVIPLPEVCLGFGIALGLCLMAALWPAISTGRTEPLKLLQEGRAAI